MAKFKYKFKTTKHDIARALAMANVHLKETILERFELIGWEFVKMAREKTAKQGGFNDVTGNLRSSIGFVVLDHGHAVRGDFELAKKGSDRYTGYKEAEKLAKKLAKDFPNGYALIVVAGMDYAAALENLHKIDVITGSSLIAETMLRDAMKKLKIKLNG